MEGEIGSLKYNELLKKTKELQKAGFDTESRRFLIENGFIGKVKQGEIQGKTLDVQIENLYQIAKEDEPIFLGFLEDLTKKTGGELRGLD
ncbi:hypothetical protein AGMMS50249_4470 [candidate division SR1 bacterium]|nr:hypothetical protein AGMMS50249_4470 [candidate division SR1 bacterium]